MRSLNCSLCVSTPNKTEDIGVYLCCIVRRVYYQFFFHSGHRKNVEGKTVDLPVYGEANGTLTVAEV